MCVYMCICILSTYACIYNYICILYRCLLFIYIFIYLIALGLCCSTWPPQLWHANSQLRHACGIQFPDQGSNLGPLHWEHGVLSTASPGKSLQVSFNFLFLNKFIYFLFYFLAVLGLCCCARAFSGCGERGLLFVAVRRLLIVVASLVAEHGLQAHGLQQLWHTGSRAQAQQLWLAGLVALRHVGSSQARA